jgi:hypothetical protein
MRVSFQPLHEWRDLQNVLREDGWLLEDEADKAIVAEHPGVTDAPAARSRLHRLGLLISCRLRIEFLPERLSSLRE